MASNALRLVSRAPTVGTGGALLAARHQRSVVQMGQVFGGVAGRDGARTGGGGVRRRVRADLVAKAALIDRRWTSVGVRQGAAVVAKRPGGLVRGS